MKQAISIRRFLLRKSFARAAVGSKNAPGVFEEATIE
jgi:hypothetical protein